MTENAEPQDTPPLGTALWVQQTSGWLSPAERGRLVPPLVRTHLRNAVGRVRLAIGLHPGRHAYIAPDRLRPPDTVLTRAAADVAAATLPVSLRVAEERLHQKAG